MTLSPQVLDLISYVNSVVWNPALWLPKGYSWTDLHPQDGRPYPNFTDILIYPIFLSIVMIFFRTWILNPLVLEPIAKLFKLKYKQVQPPPPNSVLEMMFRQHNGCVPPKLVLEASTSLNLTIREVEIWLRKRSAQSKLTKLDKFQDSAYICLYHTLITVYGLYLLWSKPWLWDMEYCFKDYPFHEISDDVWWYYMVGCGFYWSQTIWQIKYSHGKDAGMAYIHHLCTILLMVTSWACNYIRIGSLVLLIHECGDIPLQFGKILHYLKEKRLIDYVYVCFTVLWFSTRMIMYPFWILRGLFVKLPKYYELPTVSIINGMLVLLMVMNVVWSSCLVISIYKRISEGYIQNVLSSDEQEEEPPKNENVTKNQNKYD